ncbi:MAG: LysM peptidoglycan-binding domain-containing protein, partial [Oceanobacter sp.]
MSKTSGHLVTLVLALCCFFSSTTSALDLLPSAPQEYRVKQGDTLWAIAGRFTASPWQWQQIWHENPQISNPDLIFPGDLIGLVRVGNETRVGVLERGLASRTVKLSPGQVKLQPAIRIEPIESAIPAIPAGAIRGFLSENRVVDFEQLRDAPHVLGGESEHLIMGANSQLYARGDFDSSLGAVYGVYRRGKLYVDPDSEEVLGYEAVPSYRLSAALLT